MEKKNPLVLKIKDLFLFKLSLPKYFVIEVGKKEKQKRGGERGKQGAEKRKKKGEGIRRKNIEEEKKERKKQRMRKRNVFFV